MKIKFDFATLAGVLTWLMVYGISFYILHKLQTGAHQWLIHLLFLLYGGLFIALTREHSAFALGGRFGPVLLTLQLAVSFILLWLLPERNFEFLPILTVIWAAMLPFVMRTASAMLLVVLVVACWHWLVAWQTGNTVWITALLYGSFHIFAVLVQSTSRDAEAAKAELEQKHQQLVATQQLLQAASRQSERTRIARNLHDVVGHHLTALTIQLQVAGHLVTGDAKIQVDKCHQLAKLLLSDVREAVSTMRQFADISLSQALQPLLDILPEQLQVELQVPEHIMLRDLQQAQHVLCLVQEALSNSLKHSGASLVTIKAQVEYRQLQLEIYDNGVLKPHWRSGNGLAIMRERLVECGGTLQLERMGQAMHLIATMPYREQDDV